MISLKQGGNLLLWVLLSLPSQIHAAAAPFDLDLKELERQDPTASASAERKKAQNVKKSSATGAASGKVRQSSADNSEEVRYTVKPGDHIFKILLLHFGMSNEAAERLIPEIIRLNNISNIRRLTIGQTLLIPGKGQQEHVARTARKVKTHKKAEAFETAALPEKPSTPDAKGAGGSPQVTAPVVQAAPRAQVEKGPVTHVGLAPAQPVAVAAQPNLSAAKPVASAAPPVPAAIPTPQVATKAPLVAPPVAALAPQITAEPAVPAANTWICSVTERDSSKIVDATLNALSVPWSKNRIIQSAAPTTFSIRVDRYFEYKEARYIVSIGELDPYNYTLIRLLEGAGYRVLRISGREDFETVNRKILGLLGVVPDFGKHVLQGGKTTSGFLLQQDDAGGRRVIISSEPVDPHQKWVMAQGCGAR